MKIPNDKLQTLLIGHQDIFRFWGTFLREEKVLMLPVSSLLDVYFLITFN